MIVIIKDTGTGVEMLPERHKSAAAADKWLNDNKTALGTGTYFVMKLLAGYKLEFVQVLAVSPIDAVDPE